MPETPHGSTGLGNGQVALPVEYVRQIQNLLNMQGYRDYEGKQLTVDGKIGPRTQAAIKNYQARNGLTPTGLLDPQTTAAMRVGQPSPSAATRASVGAGGGASGSTGAGLGSSPTGYGTGVPPLDPYEEFNLLNRANQIDLATEQAQAEIALRADLTGAQKQRALADLAAWRDQSLRDIGEHKEQYTRGLNERYGDIIEKQPQQFAARGLSRSGLMHKKLNEIETQRDRQLRDYSESSGWATRAVGERYGQQSGQITGQANDALKMLALQAKQAEALRNFQRTELHKERIARQASLATELKNLGMSV